MARRTKKITTYTTKGSKYGARSYRKAHSKFNQRRRVKLGPMGSIGFPSQKLFKFRYAESITLTQGTLTQYMFSATNLYDPNITGTGHQPMGFDQWGTFYNHWMVVGSKITVTATGKDSSDTGATTLCVFLSDDTTANTNPLTLIEEGRCSWTTIAGFPGIGTKKLTRKYSAKKFFGLSKLGDCFDEYGASYPTNIPLENADFVIDMNSVTTACEIQLTVVIDYIVLLKEPQELTASVTNSKGDRCTKARIQYGKPHPNPFPTRSQQGVVSQVGVDDAFGDLSLDDEPLVEAPEEKPKPVPSRATSAFRAKRG